MNIRREFRAAALVSIMGVATGAMAADPIKIGFMGELSGPQAALGQDQLDALMMLVERNGGKLGGYPVQVLKRDTQLKPEVAIQVADELAEKERVPLVTGLTFSNIVMAVAKKLSAAGVVVIGSNAGPAPLAGAQCLPNLFFSSKQNDQFAEAMGIYATERGFKSMISMTPNYQAGKDYVNGFKRTFKAPLADEIYTPLNQLDFSAELSRVASAKPDAVYVFYPGGLGVSFVRAYQQANLLGKVPLLSLSTIDGTTLPALQGSAVGVISASVWGPDLPNAANKAFVADFRAKYKRIPSEYAAMSFDAALLLDSALAKVKGNVDDRKALAAAIRSADIKSVRGNFKFNTNQFPIQDFYVFEGVKDADGNATLKTIKKVVSDGKDVYAGECPLK